MHDWLVCLNGLCTDMQVQQAHTVLQVLSSCYYLILILLKQKKRNKKTSKCLLYALCMGLKEHNY